MSEIAIRVEDLGKRYRIGKRESYRTLRESITDGLGAPFRRLRSLWDSSSNGDDSAEETIWALNHVSFEIARGEVVGIIGRNGAGKSTLLKVLSRITDPTSGFVEIHGRVGSLLEVGTGFHPELTGRENIYLNGAILGMRKAEIAGKFDEIVAFSEVEKFIDTPVKHYSSGMYVRLAFAVAAHLEPEILVVDEVLAVGDAAFQAKCLGKISEVSRSGRTVLFVSHNMGVVSNLCARALHISQGTIAADGPSRQMIHDYLLCDRGSSIGDLKKLRLKGFGKTIRFTEIDFADGRRLVHFQQPLKFRFRLQSGHRHVGLSIAGTIFNALGSAVATFFCGDTFDMDAEETLDLMVTVGNFNLAPDHYHMAFSIGRGGESSARHDLDIVIGEPAFEVSPVSHGDTHIAQWNSGPWGHIVLSDTTTEKVSVEVAS